MKELSVENDIPILQPIDLKNEDIFNELDKLQPDLIIVIAYGLILPKRILNLPKYGCWNIHVSLLPKWRGAAPIQRAIEAGDTKTGVTIMQMDEGLDTGDILYQELCTIDDTDTSKILHDKLAKLSAPAVLSTLNKLKNNILYPKKQNHSQSSIAPKLSKSEAIINWSQSANIINQKIRAFNPWPVAQTRIQNNNDGFDMIRIYEAEIVKDVKFDSNNINNINNSDQSGLIINSDQNNGLIIKCGSGLLKIKKLQFPGKNISNSLDLMNSEKYKSILQIGRILQ